MQGSGWPKFGMGHFENCSWFWTVEIIILYFKKGWANGPWPLANLIPAYGFGIHSDSHDSSSLTVSTPALFAGIAHPSHNPWSKYHISRHVQTQWKNHFVSVDFLLKTIQSSLHTAGYLSCTKENFRETFSAIVPTSQTYENLYNSNLLWYKSLGKTVLLCQIYRGHKIRVTSYQLVHQALQTFLAIFIELLYVKVSEVQAAAP